MKEVHKTHRHQNEQNTYTIRGTKTYRRVEGVLIDESTGESVTVNNGGLDVNLQDSTTRAIFNVMCRPLSSAYTLAASTIPGEYTISLVDSTGLAIGDTIGLFQDSTAPASYFADIMDITNDVLTMDTPVDVAFDIDNNSPVLFELDCDLSNADGSVTPVIYSFNNQSSIEIDITRIILHITDATTMDDGKFGGIAALTRGCVLRKKNSSGDFTNYLNLKTNGNIGESCYDKTYDDKAPAGVYGVTARLTSAGQSKVGVSIRLAEGEELQLIVQDDLTDLSSFTIMTEGHFTDEV